MKQLRENGLQMQECYASGAQVPKIRLQYDL